MTNLPIRGLGSVGVVTDIDPYSLPINAYTRAKNVRFNEAKVTRAPIYRSITATLQLVLSLSMVSVLSRVLIQY